MTIPDLKHLEKKEALLLSTYTNVPLTIDSSVAEETIDDIWTIIGIRPQYSSELSVFVKSVVKGIFISGENTSSNTHEPNTRYLLFFLLFIRWV